MAVFFDTGGGDIYAGESREEVVAEMRKDLGADFDETAINELAGTTQMRLQDSNEEITDEKIALQDAYTSSLGAYCIASENY